MGAPLEDLKEQPPGSPPFRGQEFILCLPKGRAPLARAKEEEGGGGGGGGGGEEESWSPDHSMIKDKEAFQRLNFLYQAAHCVLAQNPNNQELARFYCHTQNSISRRLVLRQDSSVKRTICKSCFSLLVPGVSSTVRQRKRRHQRWTVVRCLNCGLRKRFLSNPDYTLWSEQPESLLENQTSTGAGTKGQTPNPEQEPRKASQMGKPTVPSSSPRSLLAAEETMAGTQSIGEKSVK
ncbi:ribonuclease P protein subunit p21 isoform X1 [Python bivittatus]|uniref:Ribonuclease P protein subunit p21 isoform X1 n=2 Tax=Python bivittatus TaxID=176946 RepID=A0A9F5MXD4_PYTBI|nr:ribonuclease P protein subunit p21 isoform X1 [Python bivittatus]XP_025027891.1 ribonuclease P protein subunit p21 isoform X1 [Python bivittatus]